MEKDDFLVITVLAKPGTTFASYDLLQAILVTGLQFGEMNIFHYYDANKIKLFSLASATKPGDFDLNAIGDFSCAGLTLFMDLHAVPDSEKAFALMLKTAEQLAEDLDGELRGQQLRPWNEKVLNEYLLKIRANKKIIM